MMNYKYKALELEASNRFMLSSFTNPDNHAKCCHIGGYELDNLTQVFYIQL